MSCNGCRVLRKGCSETCILRSCLHWIDTPEAQGNATLFLAKFFGRSDLLSFIAAVPEPQRPALFQSLLFEACGRTVNPVDGVVGLLSSGNWHVCEAAVETVLSGGSLKPDRDEIPSVDASQSKPLMINKSNGGTGKRGRGRAHHHHHHHHATSFCTEESEMLMLSKRGNQEKKLLNLFV